MGRTNYLLKTLQFKRICPTYACTKPVSVPRVMEHRSCRFTHTSRHTEAEINPGSHDADAYWHAYWVTSGHGSSGEQEICSGTSGSSMRKPATRKSPMQHLSPSPLGDGTMDHIGFLVSDTSSPPRLLRWNAPDRSRRGRSHQRGHTYSSRQ